MLMIPAAGEWRALFTVHDGLISRLVVSWMYSPDECPDMWGIVVDDVGRLSSAAAIEGFVGYAAPDDNPKQILSAVQREEKAYEEEAVRQNSSEEQRREADSVRRERAG